MTDADDAQGSDAHPQETPRWRPAQLRDAAPHEAEGPDPARAAAVEPDPVFLDPSFLDAPYVDAPVDPDASDASAIEPAVTEPAEIEPAVEAPTPTAAEPSPPSPPTPPTPPVTAPVAVRRPRRRDVRTPMPKLVVAVAILATMSGLMFILLRPDLIFRNNTPTGGDNAAHIWTAGYAKRVLLDHFRLYGWSNDSFAGSPVLSTYFPLPTWLIVALSFVIPFGISFKLVTILGIMTLPWACFRLARRAELSWPEPLFFAAGAFPYLLLRHFRILGGNIFSTMAGEFSFSLSLSLVVVYMGSLIALLRTGRGRTRTMLVLAAVGLSHIVPSIFALEFTVACFVCELRRARWTRQIRDLLSVGIVAAMITAFWTVPFAHNLPYSNSMDYERNTRTLRTLFPLLPHSSTLHTPADGATMASTFCLLMLVTVWVGIRRRDRFIATMAITAALSGLAFALWPRSAMWNNRLLPSWFFCVYTLGGIGAWHVAKWVVESWRRPKPAAAPSTGTTTHGSESAAESAAVTAPAPAPVKRPKEPVVGPVLLSIGVIMSALGPAFVSTHAHLPFAWAASNFTGTEGRKAYPEYRNLINTLLTLPCGRLWSEPDGKTYDNYGSTLAMTALPYWTKGCIQTSDGLYYESSMTTPFNYLTASMMSQKASHAQRRLPYQPYNMAQGIEHLRQLGVRYVLAVSAQMKKDAHAQPGLKFIVTTGPFEIFEVVDSAIAVGLATEPVVVTGVDDRAIGAYTDVGLAQWVRPQDFPPTVAANGPAYWQRSPLLRNVAPTTTTAPPVTLPPASAFIGTTSAANPATSTATRGTTPSVTTAAPATTAPRSTTATPTTATPTTTAPTKPAPTVTSTSVPRRGDGLAVRVAAPTPIENPPVVSNVVVGNQKVSFTVDRPGAPVLVRISWYPNWRAHGADGPYRVSPNFMVVIPTRTNVSLTYEYTGVELASMAVSFVGLGLAAMSGARSVRGLRERRRIRRATHAEA